jgi:hypothetical protein
MTRPTPSQIQLRRRLRELARSGRPTTCSLYAHARACALEVSCSDGELHRRGFNGRLSGVEIPPAAVAIAGARPEINSVELYDGLRLEVPTPPILGVLSPRARASWHGEQRGHAEDAEQ